MKLDESKATQSSDIQTKVIQITITFSLFLLMENDVMENYFLSDLKNKQILSQYTKKIRDMKRKTTG